MAIDRIDASKLLEHILRNKKPLLQFLLVDDGVFRKVAVRVLQKLSQNSLQVFAGKTPILDFVDSNAALGLFSDKQNPAIIELPPKLSAKQWEECKGDLFRLPRPPGVLAYFFAPTSFRNTLKDVGFEGLAEFRLCYAPSGEESLRCAEILRKQYPTLSELPPDQAKSLMTRGLEHYSGDLCALDDHMERMQKGNLKFEDALVIQTEVNAFHVVDALAYGDRARLELRVQQCQSGGEDATAIFSAVLYFMKQLVRVEAERKKNPNLRMVFEKVGVPYPSQARMQAATGNISNEKLIRFFAHAAELEITLRTHRKPHDLLSIELLGLIS